MFDEWKARRRARKVTYDGIAESSARAANDAYEASKEGDEDKRNRAEARIRENAKVLKEDDKKEKSGIIPAIITGVVSVVTTLIVVGSNKSNLRQLPGWSEEHTPVTPEEKTIVQNAVDNGSSVRKSRF